jgi:hypothetical protein
MGWRIETNAASTYLARYFSIDLLVALECQVSGRKTRARIMVTTNNHRFAMLSDDVRTKFVVAVDAVDDNFGFVYKYESYSTNLLVLQSIMSNELLVGIVIELSEPWSCYYSKAWRN